MTEPAWSVRQLAESDADSFRTLRLEALRQDPDAFGSSYEAEAADAPERFGLRLAEGRVFGLFRAGALVGIHNEAAIGLYRKLGFVQYGLEKRALKQGERYDDELLMALELARFSGPAGG